MQKGKKEGYKITDTPTIVSEVLCGPSMLVSFVKYTVKLDFYFKKNIFKKGGRSDDVSQKFT